ncbi:MAG: DUF47 family protein [Verrucomicrobium sp.]|nr:DUF47 family protein [Verrucomicrobium sp.]
MSSFWKKILGKDEKFFDLLDASAHEAGITARCLRELLQKAGDGGLSEADLSEFSLHRNKDKEITRKITRELCRTFVTPLEREDIEALSESLYRIPKTVQKIGERFLFCSESLLKDKSLLRQAEILEQATQVVCRLIQLLRSGEAIEKASDLHGRLQQLEGEADRLFTAMLREAYAHRDAKELILLKDVCELMEKAIDRCRDVGNTVFQVVLKSS